MSRHRSFAAALHWSCESLPENERFILCPLSVFAGAFTRDAAGAVAADSVIAVHEVVGGMANLVAKSLLSVDLSSAVAPYRLLDTTRAYALQKRTESGKFEPIARCHAECHRLYLSEPRRTGSTTRR